MVKTKLLKVAKKTLLLKKTPVKMLEKTMNLQDVTATVIVVGLEMKMMPKTEEMLQMSYPQLMTTTHVLSPAEWATATRNVRTA